MWQLKDSPLCCNLVKSFILLAAAKTIISADITVDDLDYGNDSLLTTRLPMTFNTTALSIDTIIYSVKVVSIVFGMMLLLSFLMMLLTVIYRRNYPEKLIPLTTIILSKVRKSTPFSPASAASSTQHLSDSISISDQAHLIQTPSRGVNIRRWGTVDPPNFSASTGSVTTILLAPTHWLRGLVTGVRANRASSDLTDLVSFTARPGRSDSTVSSIVSDTC